MRETYKNTELDLSCKYYCVIEYHPEDMLGEDIKLSFNKDIFTTVTSYENEGAIFILIILESNNLKALRDEIVESIWEKEQICVNKELT